MAVAVAAAPGQQSKRTKKEGRAAWCLNTIRGDCLATQLPVRHQYEQDRYPCAITIRLYREFGARKMKVCSFEKAREAIRGTNIDG